MAVAASTISSVASFRSHSHSSGATGQQQGATNVAVGSVASRNVFGQSIRTSPLLAPSLAQENLTRTALARAATSSSSKDSVRQFCTDKFGARQGLQVIARRIGRRQPGAPLVVARARRASASSGDKQREEKRSVENIPSSPPPPSTATNSVGVQEEEAIEKSAVSEAPVEELQEEKRVEASNGSGEGAADSVDEIGKAIRDIRRERAAAGLGLEDSAGTTDFWRGVVEETKLIDWPDFSKVLGTTWVVVAMILGSSIVLLTVNAILAATSDFVFHDPAIKDIIKPS